MRNFKELLSQFGARQGGGETNPADPFGDVDVERVFATASLQYGTGGERLVPVGRGHDIEMNDDNIETLRAQYGPIAIVGRKLGDGGRIDMEHVAAEVAIRDLPALCGELSQECFGKPIPYEKLLGERREVLIAYVLGRRGTAAEERERDRRRRLGGSLPGRLRLGAGDSLTSLGRRIVSKVTDLKGGEK